MEVHPIVKVAHWCFDNPHMQACAIKETPRCCSATLTIVTSSCTTTQPSVAPSNRSRCDRCMAPDMSEVGSRSTCAGGAAPGVPANFPGVRALEAQITQTWVVIGSAPERPVIFAL